jgi:hypothetical protein
MTDGFHVRTNSLYVAILDEASPANRPGFLQATLEAAKQKAVSQKLADYCALFIFNDELMRLAHQGELLTWTLLFDGVFRAVADAEPDGLPSPSSLSNLGNSVLTARLVCPTGRLLLTCMDEFGASQQPFIELAPGTYDVAVQRDEDQEFKHCFIESLGDYPAGDGPDWRIGIRRV